MRKLRLIKTGIPSSRLIDDSGDAPVELDRLELNLDEISESELRWISMLFERGWQAETPRGWQTETPTELQKESES